MDEGEQGAPPAFDRDHDALHRAIYDYFRRMAGGIGVPFCPPKLSDPEGDFTEALQSAGIGDHYANETDPAAQVQVELLSDSLSAFYAEQPTAMPTVDRAWSQKLMGVIDAMEQCFPEILQLPAESEEKPMSELEFRFAACSPLKQSVESLESSDQGQMQPVTVGPPFNPPDTMPFGGTMTRDDSAQPILASSPPLNAEAIGLELIADPFTLAPSLETVVDDGFAAAETDPIEEDSNLKKRKVPPATVDNLHPSIEPSSKKLKEQEIKIKKMKTELKRAKDTIQQLSRVQDAVEEGMLLKKVSEGAERKEKAMAAAVPFEQRYQELIHFQRGHGHCRVPCTSKENPGLARWVQTLRAAYKEKQKRGAKYFGQLTDERQKKLDELGFEWSIQAPKATWEQRFEELKAYKEENGHCRVVRSYSKNPALGEWCHRQRFLAHKNQLEESKVKQLADLGFKIWVRKQGMAWEDHFEKLLDFRRKFQHLNVPPPDTRTKAKQVLVTATTGATGTTEEGDIESEKGTGTVSLEEAEVGLPNEGSAAEEYKEEQAFRRWVVAQRDNYHLKYKKGVKSTLNKARVKKLEGIGFDWARVGEENDLRKMRRGELHHRNDPSIWNRRLAEVVEYKKRFGDCNIPKEWSENKQLGAWVSTQRKMYKAMLAGERSSLTPERRTALESIGFSWILRPARTRIEILEIENLQKNAMLEVTVNQDLPV